MTDTPLAWKKLEFFDNHFTDSGTRFDYSSVRSIEYCRVKTETTTNFVIKDTTYTGSLTIHVDGLPKPVELYSPGQRGLLDAFRDTEKGADQVFNIYRHIAPRTYDARLRRYLTELKDRGYFTYDGKCFYPDGTVKNGEQRVDIHQYLVWRQPFCMRIEVDAKKEKKKGWAAVANFFVGSSQSVPIVTTTDEDCFVALLKSMYGIFWIRMDGNTYGGSRSFFKTDLLASSKLTESEDAKKEGGPAVDGFVRHCGELATRAAEMARPRAGLMAMRWGEGFQTYGAEDIKLAQRLAFENVNAASWGLALGLLTTAVCVKDGSFPGSPEFTALKVRVFNEMYRCMADPIPAVLFKLAEKELQNAVAQVALEAVQSVVPIVQKSAERLRAGDPHPFLPLYEVFAKRTGLWNTDDPGHLVTALDKFTVDLLATASAMVGVPIGRRQVEV